MAIQRVGPSVPNFNRQKDPTAELKDAANRAVMNKDFDADVAAPEKFDARSGVNLAVSMKDQRENGVLSRTAFNVDGQLYIQETVMHSGSGETKEVWKRGKKPLVV